MADTAQASGQITSPAQGGGAMHGLGATFTLAGYAGVPVERPATGSVHHRPCAKGLFARVERRRDRRRDGWEPIVEDTARSQYGPAQPPGTRPLRRHPAAAPDDPSNTFDRSARTTNAMGTTIVYGYSADEGVSAGHRRQVALLRRIRYADYDEQSLRDGIVERQRHAAFVPLPPAAVKPRVPGAGGTP
ncbi:hypothetical protein ACIO93_43915 [Streptomyces sp. NPDC087903]|uniref:hypothetical protein n=1 Tax=Streptomyces sp. NPDC087903 TaxID=3365819 RepID=UPI0038288BE9